MSRTYKTAPFWAQLNKPKLTGIMVEEFHDHSRSECDLPATPLDAHHNNRTRCWYSYKTNGRNTLCGCDLCTGQSWRRIERRSKRRKSNQNRRGFATDVLFYEDPQEFDDYDYKTSGYW